MIHRVTCLAACLSLCAAAAGCSDDSSSTSYSPGPGADASAETSAEAAAEDGSPADGAQDAAQPDAGEDGANDAQQEATQEASAEAAAGWNIEVVDGTPKFKSRVAIATGPDDQPRLAYNIATSDDGYKTPSVWYAERKNGAWKVLEAAAAAGVSNEFPVIAVDASSKASVVYKRADQGQNDLFLVKGDGSGFSAPVNLTNSADSDEFAPMVAFDQTGTLHVIFQRTKEDPNATPPKTLTLGYLQVSPSGVVSGGTDVSPTSDFALNPDYSLAVEPSGTVHVTYCKPGSSTLNNVAWYRRREGGQWGEELRLTAADQDAWGPVVGADDSGTVHFVYVIGADWDHKTLSYDRLVAGSLAGAKALSTSVLDRSYYLGMRVRLDGVVHVAFSRLYDVGGSKNADVHYLRGADGLFDPEERLTSTDALDEDAIALALSGNGSPMVAFVENLSTFPDGKIYFASRP